MYHLLIIVLDAAECGLWGKLKCAAS